MVASRIVTRSSTADVGGGLKMTVTASIGAGHDELDISLNDVASQNTTDLRHRIPRRRTMNAGGSQAPTQQVPTQGAGVLTQPSPNGLVRGGGMVLPGDFNSPFFQFGETSGARTPGPDPSGFWDMMRAMMLNQPMTGFCMPVTMLQPTFQPDGRREVQQNVVESAELFAQHLKNLMADFCLNPSPEGPENKEFSRSQQRDKGKGPERRANKKKASHRDKETASKRREPPKEGQGESESHVSVFSRMRVPVTERLYGRRNTFLQSEAGKIWMPCEEQCNRHREEHFNRYQTLMNVVTFSEEVLCRSFPATLDGLASEWFNELPEGKIESWEDLARRFLVHFAGNRKKKLHFLHHLSVRQRPDEPLREFLARWKLETTRVYGADDKTRLSTFHLVLRSGDFSKCLALEKPREYSNALAMAEDEAEAEELEANKKKEEAGRLGSIAMAVRPTLRKVTIDERPHLPVGNRFRKGRDPRDRRSHGKDVYEEGSEEAAGHDTDACKVLKREIENLIQAGYLRQFVKKKSTWRKDDGKKSGDNRGKKPAGTQQKKRKEIGLLSDEEEEDDPRQKRIEESRMIYGGNTGGDNAEQRKKWVHSAYVGDVRSAPGPSKVAKTEPLLLVQRTCLRSHHPTETPWSSGDIIDSEGLIEVMVTSGDGEHRKTIPAEFMVVRLLGSHNLILGRPALEDLDSVTLVKYLSMKFPTDSGIGVCRGNQNLARLCYQKQTKKMDAQDLRVDSIATALLKEEEGRPRAEPAEDTEDVVIMEEHQEKKIKLGTNISSELRSKIIQYQIQMKPRAAIKAQALANFMVECTARDNNPIPTAKEGEWWTLSTDGSLAGKACGGGVVIQSPEGFRSYHAIKFQFKVSNNEAEYEALLSGLRLILNLKAEYVRIRCDSRLVVSQIKGAFDTKEERMRLYKEAALELLKILKGYELVQIPRAENTEADVLSKLSNDDPEHISKMARVEDLGSLSIHVQLVSIITEEANGWIAELIRYKKDGILPGDETTARLIKRRAPSYVIENGRLYNRSYNGTLLRCVDEARAGQIME
ncbi:unnamed protein product [Cuscuta campestris]|uniref:Uncharacterized protein n=1 Tax=Cuscuta campestris TaxID=132261 RepID=A0A484KNJ5_9ASTE|nr:unnamed protein product [Cuscuta campestris]